jgi:Holliday junction resolvase RusA-like endonuclease
VCNLLPPTLPNSPQAIECELDLLASEIIVLVEPEELLRKPKNRKQGARFPDREKAFKDEARRQTVGLGRSGFAGPTPVSVQLEIHVPEGGQQPLMPGVVKAYIDALQGIAYDDDRQIEHLVVHRRGLDHPMMDGYEPKDGGRKGQVYIEIKPLEAYTRLYDRTFRRLIFRGNAQSPFRNNWGVRDETKLLKLKAKRSCMSNGPGAQAADNLIASYEEERLTSGTFADIDRPGPLSDDMRRAFRLFPEHALHSALRGVIGSRLMLPPRGMGKGTSSAWEGEVERRIERHRRHLLMARVPLRSWVALDIAVRGETIDSMDLDNLARLIITHFEKAFCVREGTVTSYRVYWAVGSPEGVQVRVMSDTRMLGLEIALGESRGQMVDSIHGRPSCAG